MMNINKSRLSRSSSACLRGVKKTLEGRRGRGKKRGTDRVKFVFRGRKGVLFGGDANNRPKDIRKLM